MRDLNGEPKNRHQSDCVDSRLCRAVEHLLAEPPPVDSMRRALARAQRLATTDAKREAGKPDVGKPDAGKHTAARKPRLPGFDQLEDRRALSGLAWDVTALEGSCTPLLDVVAVVTTESLRPVMSSYSTHGPTSLDDSLEAVGDGRWTPEPVLRNEVQMAVPIDFDQVGEDSELEEVLGTLVS